MKLIAGLGNPGTKYINTRHNIGFEITEKLVSRYNAKFKKPFFNKAKEAGISICGEKITVAQPLTYMNLSGNSIFKFYRNLHLNSKDILVVCDDINLPFGKLRMRSAGSAGGHNGLESVINMLGSEDFPRLRVGIKQDADIENLSDYVLSEFTEEECAQMGDIVNRAISACEAWVKDGIEAVMNKYN
ncbi:MAG: aminoacyl-tRNA hydrolase [Candidatus Omnitrophica bacterium]|nr:aminoacyl-tRNA hydrolase [Candidatus Omnitrophota bacterium]